MPGVCMNLRGQLRRVLIAGLVLSPVHVQGRAGDTEQPLHIESDTAEFNDRTGISVYRGDVRVTQGTMVLTGNVVTVVAPDQLIKTITAEGDLSTFHQINDDGEQIDAQAEHMEYDATTNKLILLRRARIDKTEHSFASERIEYNIVTKIIDAGDPANGNRVRMTIIPKKAQSKP